MGLPAPEQQPGRAVDNQMQMQQQLQITGTTLEQGALAQLYGGLLQLAGRQMEPTVAGIRSAGQIGAAQASALGQQMAAQASAAGTLGAAQTGAAAQRSVAQTRLQGTLAQIAGQLDLETKKGQDALERLTKELASKETVADMQTAAQRYSARLQKTGQVQAAGKSAAATTKAAATSAAAQKEVAKMGIKGKLGGGDFGKGTIAAESSARQAEELQKLQAQLGLGDFDTGTIEKQQQAQQEREMALSQEQAAQQLGLGDYGDSGGIIGAQSAAKIAEMQEAAKQKLGTGTPLLDDQGQVRTEFNPADYASLGELASQGIEQRLTQAQRQELGADQMQTHADILDVQQGKIADRLSGITTPFANMFGLGPSGQATSGINVNQNIQGAGQIFPQTQAIDLESGAAGNPFMQPLTGLAGMTGAQNAGPNQLLAMQGAMNAQNQLGMAANQNLAQMGIGAANNLAGSFNQGMATQTQAMQPLSTAAGQGLAAIPGAQGAALAGMGNVGMGQV